MFGIASEHSCPIKLACSGVIKFYFTQNYLEELKFDVHIHLADSETWANSNGLSFS